VRDKLYEWSELFKNIGLGLFINGTYGLLKEDDVLKNAYISVLSIIIMYLMILAQRKLK